MKEKIGEVIIHLSLNKTPLKSGKHAAYIRVQHKSQNRYYTCHNEFSVKEWERFEKFPDVSHPVMIYFQNFKDAVLTLLREDSFSFTALSNLTKRSKNNSLQEHLLAYAQSYSDAGKHNTASIYKDTCSSLNRFLSEKTIPIGRFTKEQGEEFIKWMESNGLSPTTISMRLRALSAVFEKARKEHIISVHPIKTIKKPYQRKRDLDISQESLSKLLGATQEQIGYDNLHWLHYWRASYFGNGMNIRDLLLLKPSNLKYGEIIFIRRKTEESSGRKIHIPLTEDFLKELNAISGGNTYIIPEMDPYKPYSFEEFRRIQQVIKNINNHLKKTCTILKIPEKVTTGTARHTFATRMLQAGVPIEFISDSMGHSRISTTQFYLEGYTKEQRLSYAKALKVDK